MPATETDAKALEAIRTSGLEKLPVYLFQFKPQLQLDDVVLAEGTAVGMGQTQYYTMTFMGPHHTYTDTGVATVGDEIVFGINGNGITSDVVQERLETVPFNSAAENMHQTALHFWMEHDFFDHLAAQVYGVHTQRMPSAGTFSIPLSVEYAFGIPKSGYYLLRQLDVKRNVQTVAAPSDQSRFRFLSHIGMQGSFLEASVLEQLFGRGQIPARSTARILQEANQQQIPIYTITPDNWEEILPQLAVSADVKTDIKTAIHAGKQAIVPQREVMVGNWSGTGYILQDRITGAGVYLIDGGLKGGTHEGCEIEQTKLIRTNPRLKVIKDVLFERFEEEQIYWTAQLEQAKKLDNQAQISQATQMLDISARILVGFLIALDIDIRLEGDGCFVAQAYGQPDEITLPLLYNWTGQQQITVPFTVAQLAFCWHYKWEVIQHGNSDTVLGTSDQPIILATFTEPGQYTAKVSARCKAIEKERVSSEVKVYIHDKLATKNFCLL